MQAQLAIRPLETPPTTLEIEGSQHPPVGLRDKWNLFWQKTLEAGRQEDRRSTLQRFKGIFWDYNVGQLKGWFRGLGNGLKNFLKPRSSLYTASPQEIFREIKNLPDASLDYGISYMEADWEARGQMNSEKAVEGGMWLLKIYLGLKSVKKGFFKAIGKF